MFSTLPKLLIILLALLQFIAPLVHAHVGEEPSNQGIHLPGFELYGTNSDSPSFSADHLIIDKCSLISIGSAIKHKKLCPDNNSSQDFLTTRNFLLKSFLKSSQIERSHSQHKPVLPVIIRLLSSRAPPTK